MIQKRVAEYVKRMFNNKLIDIKIKQYLVQNDPRPGRFYILPKIHKVNNPGRPIVSSNNHPTERVSQFVDYYLKPSVNTVPSYVKDTTDFLNKLANLNTINTLPDNAILVTLDVTSLYTNIPHSEGIEACHFFLRKRNDKHIPMETLCDLIQIILNMNNFTFNNKHYLQKHGTAMGTKMAPSFANLFLAKFEHDALTNALYPPHTWLRFLDDIFVIWTEGSDKLKVFVDYLINLHPTIKLTCLHSLTNIPFLDVMVSLKDGLIETDLYTKPTDKHRYLLISSCHPTHTKRFIPYSLALHLLCICSDNDTYKQRCKRCKNISDIRIRTKLTEPTNTDQSSSPSGSFWCNKTSCTACSFIDDGRNQYTFYCTGETFKIKSHITCEIPNVIYMIQCTKCNLQHIGETKHRLKDRFNEHRRPIINPFCSYTPTAVSRHFLTSGHAEDHMILIPLEQLHTSRDSIRKACEAFLIHRGKTLEPAGLNRRDEM